MDLQTTRQRILVVDDEPVIADTLALILQRAGYESFAVYGGKEALEAVATWKPDVMVTDVQMRPLNGIEVAMQVRASNPECKVYLMSGKASTADLLKEAKAMGHTFDILAKPFHPQGLFDRLNEMGVLNHAHKG